MYYLIFFAQILLFYLTSRKVTSAVYAFIRNYFSKKNTLRLFSFLFLPGTFLHEASHYITASLLLVPVGEFNLMPKYENEGIQMGSVSIAKTDPIRRFIIGISPVFIGIFTVLLLSYIIRFTDIYWQKGVAALFMFTIANSMFSSRKDMEGAVKLFITITAVIIAAYLLNIDIKLNLSEDSIIKLNEYVRTSVEWFMLPLMINLLLIISKRLR